MDMDNRNLQTEINMKENINQENLTEKEGINGAKEDTTKDNLIRV